MPLYDKHIQPFYKFLDTFFSITRIVSQSKFRKTSSMTRKHDRCLILGNGPSLIDALENSKGCLDHYDLIAVNHFATSPEYVKYRPNKYVLCDPAFWFDESFKEHFPKVNCFYKTLVEVTEWPLEIYLPYQANKCETIKEYFLNNSLLAIKYYNKTRFEGWGQNVVYQKQWGMPRTQNVLIAALMLAIYSGYDIIYLAGADNDWMHNLWVDEMNNLRLNDIHYYDNNAAVNNARFLTGSIVDQMCSLYYTFSGYQHINHFASKNNCKIFNASPNSFIDTFPKKYLI